MNRVSCRATRLILSLRVWRIPRVIADIDYELVGIKRTVASHGRSISSRDDAADCQCDIGLTSLQAARATRKSWQQSLRIS